MQGEAQSKSLVLFASGRGKNAEAIIRYFEKAGTARVKLIVCNNVQAGVLDIARAHNIPFLLTDKNTFGEQLFLQQIAEYKPDLIVLAGFLWKIPESLIRLFKDKIINIHPALLPKYGGKGMYGARVHQAVLEQKDEESGITIHFVNEHYDEGAIILQARCKLLAEDSAEKIAEKVTRLEHRFLPQAVEYLLNEQ